jgi:hypothetical protein
MTTTRLFLIVLMLVLAYYGFKAIGAQIQGTVERSAAQIERMK